MYCVKCGVKLQDGAKKCPLCNTPVMNEENIESLNKSYSELFPKESKHKIMTILGSLTTLFIIAALVVMIVCLELYSSLKWGGIVMMSLLLVFVYFILPFYFGKYKPMIFVPISYAMLLGYLLYICLYTNGHWFLSFAFPLVSILFVDLILAISLYRFIKGGRLFITGGLFIFIGCSTMLIELFQNITFGTKGLIWSLAVTTSLSLLGLFLLLCGIIKPLREYLERKFFL